MLSDRKLILAANYCQFVILDFSEMLYSEKTTLKVDIVMTGKIHPTFSIPQLTPLEKFGRINHYD